MVLILSHNCTLNIWPDMIRIVGPKTDREYTPKKRGAIKIFSNGSRKRLFEFIHQIEFYRLTFVTLTYPRVFPDDGREVKKHLRRFRARLERKFGKLRVMWRMEYQERGAPHFHLLIMDAPWICKLWLSHAWYNCVKSGDRKHLIYGTRIEAVAKKGENGKVFAYLGKYLGKVDNKERENKNEWSGRYWGKWNIEKEGPIEIEVDYGEIVRAVSVVVSSRGSNKAFTPRDVARCRVFGGSVGSGNVRDAVIRQIRRNREAKHERAT